MKIVTILFIITIPSLSPLSEKMKHYCYILFFSDTDFKYVMSYYNDFSKCLIEGSPLFYVKRHIILDNKL